MKHLFFAGLLCFIFAQVLAQNPYKVVAIKGNVKVDGKTLAKNDVVQANATLAFSTPADMLRVEQGINRFDIKATDTQSSGLKKLFSELLVIAGRDKGTSKASTRGEVSSVEGLQKYLAANPAGNKQSRKIRDDDAKEMVIAQPFLIIGKATCGMSIGAMPLNADNFVYVSYTYTGAASLNNDGNEKINIDKNTIAYQIPQNNKSFTLSTDLLKIGNTKIKPEEAKDFCLYYSNGSAINEFLPVFIDENDANFIAQIKDELDFAQKETQSNKEKVFDAIVSYLIRYHGTPDLDNLRVWLKTKFNF